DVAHAGHVLDDVLRAALLAAILHRAGERDLAVAHLHGDVGRVDHGIVRQAIAHVLGDALVGAAIALRAAADVRAVRLVAAASAAPHVLAGVASGFRAVQAAFARGRAVAAGPARSFAAERTAAPSRSVMPRITAHRPPVAAPGLALPAGGAFVGP